jgi:Peptidase A4 family
MRTRESQVGSSARIMARLLWVLAAIAALSVSLGGRVRAVTPWKVASVASLRQVVTDCNGQSLTSLIPPAGFGMPLSQFGRASGATSPDVQKAESPNIHWLPVSCGANPDGAISAPSPGSNIPASGEIDWHYWSGFQTDSTGGTYHAVEMEWKVPSVSSARVKRVSSAWTGLGGCSSNGDILVQTGTESDQNADGSVTYYPWWESCKINGIQRITAFNVHAHDDVFGSVIHSGYGQANIILTNLTTGAGVNFYTTWSTTYTIGGKGDWVLERAKVSGTHPYLAPINSGTYVTFQEMYGQANGSNYFYPLGSLKRYYIYMWTCSWATRMAHTGTISADGTSVAVYFDSSGDNNVC